MDPTPIGPSDPPPMMMEPTEDGGVMVTPTPGEDAGPGMPTGPTPEEVFNSTVVPLMQENCTDCHAPGGAAAYDFVNTANDYVAAQTRAGFIDRENIEESRVLAKGDHDGPAWTPAQEEVIRAWLTAEVNGAPTETRFDPEAVNQGFNNWDLSPLGAPGSALHFGIEYYDAGYKFSAVTFTAGTEGLLVYFPVIEIYEGDALRQTIPISTENVTVDPSQNYVFDDLYAPLRYAETKIGISFRRVSTLFGDSYGVVRCLQTQEFTEHAQPELQFSCARCHSGNNPDAVVKMDLTELDLVTNAQSQRKSCDRVLARLDRDDPANSQLFRVVDPVLGPATGHPFQFDTGAQVDSLRANILLWLAQEPR